MLVEIQVLENGASKGMPYLAPFDINDEFNSLLHHIQERIGIRDPEVIWEGKILSFTASSVSFGTIFEHQRNIQVTVRSRKVEDDMVDFNSLLEFRCRSTSSIPKEGRFDLEQKSQIFGNQITNSYAYDLPSSQVELVKVQEDEINNISWRSNYSRDEHEPSYLQMQVYELKSASDMDNQMLENEFNHYKISENVDSYQTPKESQNINERIKDFQSPEQKISKRISKRAQQIKPPKVENEVQKEINNDQTGESIFEVEAVLDAYKLNKGLWLYLIKWKGYPMDKCTWEPQRCLGDKTTKSWAQTLRKQIKKLSKKGEYKPLKWKLPCGMGEQIELL